MPYNQTIYYDYLFSNCSILSTKFLHTVTTKIARDTGFNPSVVSFLWHNIVDVTDEARKADTAHQLADVDVAVRPELDVSAISEVARRAQGKVFCRPVSDRDGTDLAFRDVAFIHPDTAREHHQPAEFVRLEIHSIPVGKGQLDCGARGCARRVVDSATRQRHNAGRGRSQQPIAERQGNGFLRCKSAIHI